VESSVKKNITKHLNTYIRNTIDEILYTYMYVSHSSDLKGILACKSVWTDSGKKPSYSVMKKLLEAVSAADTDGVAAR